MPPLARPLRIALVFSALLFTAHLALFPLAENDLFFHLRIGELIRAQHRIPFLNLFSFTWPDHPDPDLAWLFQLLVSLLHAAGGFPALVLFKAACVTLAFALAHAAARRDGAAPLAAALAVAAGALAAEQRMVERPHLVTFVGIGALLLLLGAIERGRPRLAWLLPPLVALWANFHAGVFFAPLILILHLGGALLDALPARSRRCDRPPRALFAAAALTVLCIFCTPAWRLLPAYLLWHTGLGATRNVEEFRHAEPYSDPWFFVLLTICALALLLEGRAVRLRRALPIAVAALLALRSVRFVAEWAILATPLVCSGLTRLLAPVDARPRLRAAAAALAALALAATVGAARAGRPLALGLAPDVVPFAAIDFATQNGLRDRMYNDLDVGCYLLWEGWPRFRVFQDARLPAYPDEFHRALDETPLAPGPWDALLRRYGVDAALLAEPGVNMRAGSFDPAEWALVYRAADGLVFARRTDAHRELIERYEQPFTFHFTFTEGAAPIPLAAPPARSPVSVCEWQTRLARGLDALGDPERALDARARALDAGCLAPTDEAEVRYRLGARAQLAGRADLAIAHYDRALALRPDDPRALANRGFARLAAGSPPDRAAARADLARALVLDPARADVRDQLARLPPP
jgi:tetratricopeptide (TPR) repeat protein